MFENRLEVVPIDAALFDTWRDDLKIRWAHLRSSSGKMNPQEALGTVTDILNQRLASGLETAEQFVFSISDAGQIKGSFWLEIKGDKGFLYDVVLNESVRLENLRDLIEKIAISRGALELRVNVFSSDQLLMSLTTPNTYMSVNSQMWLLDNPDIDANKVDSGLTLRPMEWNEFSDYRQWQINIYAAEKVAAGNCSLEEALSESMQEVAKLLPDGLKSEGQFIFIAELKSERIGTVWVDIDRELEVPQAFVIYIEIDQALRGQGLGRELMYATQLEGRKLGAKGFALSVFDHNSVAKNLYMSVGFQVTEVLKKRILKSE